MKRFKSQIAIAIFVCTFVMFSSAVKARELGVVDLTKVIDNYTEAQKVTAELKVKETELQNFLQDAQKKVEAAKTPVEKKNLQEKFGEEFNVKRSAYIKQQSEKWGKIEDSIYQEIEVLYNTKKYEMILNKQAAIIGGTDITEELIKILNDKVKK